MDTRIFASNLIALNETRSDGRRSSREAAEDAYYKRHTPADNRALRIASVVAAVCFGLVTIGPWLQ